MNKHTLISLFLILTTCSFVFMPASTHADLINPDYTAKTCKAGEEEVEATYKTEKPFGGTRTEDETKKYADNPDYYELVSEGHSFGGRVKYCLKVDKARSHHDIVIFSIIVAGVAVASIGGLYLVRRKVARK